MRQIINLQVNSDGSEYILDDDECPLSILMNHPTSRGKWEEILFILKFSLLLLSCMTTYSLLRSFTSVDVIFCSFAMQWNLCNLTEMASEMCKLSFKHGEREKERNF